MGVLHRRHAWALGCVALAVSCVLLLLGAQAAGGVAFLAGGLLLAWRGASRAARRAWEAGVAPRGGWAPFALGVLLALTGASLALGLAGALPVPARVVAGALAAQALLAVLGHDGASARRGFRRRAVPATGHAVALGGSVAVAATGDAFNAGIGLAYASGLSLLLLHAHWMQRMGAKPAEGVEGWEVAVLGAIVVAVGAMSLVYAGESALPALLPHVEGPAIAVALVAGGAGLALACAPPPAPAFLRTRAGSVLDVLAHGGAAIALLNVLFLGFSLVSGWSLKLVFAVLFGWQLTVIGMEYRTLRHAERRRRRLRAVERAPPRVGREPVTVVVPAAFEADVLPVSMAHNLAVDYPLRFILVPAVKSTDRTVELAHAYAARHPGRVRVVEGNTGSKAEDLNKAWKSIDTRHVLLLDADETVDEESVLRALHVLETRPEVGVVQGRKVSRSPHDGFLARFISAERRYCTWMDHVMHGEDLGSSHFGGSAAMLRREVPEAVGGWTDQTMTEDIEFTLRLHLDDRWKIAYHPEMVVREADPVDFKELLRQRTRWARGWAQCFGLYFPEVVKARKRLGARRAFGLTWLLLIALSALWTTFVPAMLLMRLAGVSPLLPLVVAFPLTLILLPSRLLAYGYAAFRDPVIPLPSTPGRFAELALHAYVWILVGWFVQLHALYLELSSAPRVWYVTGKRGAARAKKGGAPG